jgi:short-subunit dehydrogenase
MASLNFVAPAAVRTTRLTLTRLTRPVLPGLLARGAGSIVNFASVLAFHPWPEFGVYSAAKAYVARFSQAL